VILWVSYFGFIQFLFLHVAPFLATDFMNHVRCLHCGRPTGSESTIRDRVMNKHKQNIFQITPSLNTICHKYYTSSVSQHALSVVSNNYNLIRSFDDGVGHSLAWKVWRLRFLRVRWLWFLLLGLLLGLGP